MDGPTASGKTAVGLAVAERCGIDFVSTGRLYRACVVILERARVPRERFEDETSLELIERAMFTYKPSQDVFVNGVNLTRYLHTPAVDENLPHLACIERVRAVIRRVQYDLSMRNRNLLVEGRDIGSVVFPRARLKLYLTASLDVRAYRRLNQRRAKGLPTGSVEEVRREIEVRDKLDTNRKKSPLVIPNGARIIDSSALTFDQTVERVLEQVFEVFPSYRPLARKRLYA